MIQHRRVLSIEKKHPISKNDSVEELSIQIAQ